MEAVRASRDQPRLVVEPLGQPIAQARRDVGEDARFESLDGLREGDEWLEKRARRPGDPTVEVLLRPAGLQVVEPFRQTLLEKVGTIQPPIVLLAFVKL